jgi:hypothetical protein
MQVIAQALVLLLGRFEIAGRCQIEQTGIVSGVSFCNAESTPRAPAHRPIVQICKGFSATSGREPHVPRQPP